MALESERSVLGRHPAAVVHDGDPRDAAALDLDGDPRRARVESVLDELLHRGRRPLDDLARGDLVDEGGGKDADGTRHGPGCYRVFRTVTARSTSAISRGRSQERHSGPFSVTRMSSSILTPVFHHFGSTPSIFAGM